MKEVIPDIEYFPLKDFYISEIVDHYSYELQELERKVKEINRIYKKSDTKLVALGFEIIDKDYDFETNTVKGSVIDFLTKKPLQKATLRIDQYEKPIITDTLGQFEIQKFPEENVKIFISREGYEETVIDAETLFLSYYQIALKPEGIWLEKVLVEDSNSKLKKKTFGQKRKGFLLTSSLIDGNYGEAGKKIDPKGRKVILNSINIYVSNVKSNTFKLLIDIYGIDKNGFPGKSLLDKKIDVVDNLKEGWISIDVSDKIIITEQPVYIGVQWTENGFDSYEETVHIGIKGKEGLYRKSQNEEWKISSFYSWIINAKCYILE